MNDDGAPPKRWWSRNELEINLALLAVCIVMLVIGSIIPHGILTGAGLLGAIFFATYAVYAYVRRHY